MQLELSGTAIAFINVTDRERALAFYCDTLGQRLRNSDDFGDFIEFGRALMRVTVMADHRPTGQPVIGWNVNDIGAAVDALVEQGIAFTRYEGMDQDDRGIWTAPDGQAKIAFFADPDGNVLSLSQA